MQRRRIFSLPLLSTSTPGRRGCLSLSDMLLIISCRSLSSLAILYRLLHLFSLLYPYGQSRANALQDNLQIKDGTSEIIVISTPQSLRLLGTLLLRAPKGCVAISSFTARLLRLRLAMTTLIAGLGHSRVRPALTRLFMLISIVL